MYVYAIYVCEAVTQSQLTPIYEHISHDGSRKPTYNHIHQLETPSKNEKKKKKRVATDMYILIYTLTF